MLTKKKALLGRGSRWRAAGGVREPRRTALPCGCSLGFYGNGVSFQVVSGQSSSSPMPGLARGPSWWHTSLGQDGFQRQGSWEVGQLLPPTGPSQILLVSFQGSIMFLVRAYCCETAHASGYYCAWPRWAGSVNGSLTYLHMSSCFSFFGEH